MNSQIVYNQLMELTSTLIEIGICDDQNFPSLKAENNGVQKIITADKTNIFLKNVLYEDIYQAVRKSRAFNIKLLDGALLVLQYEFVNNELLKSRLCFFPDPDLITYQEALEAYSRDELYADILYKQRVCFPIRFDFDNREGVFSDVDHPISHLTLGQYEHCRIPVSSGLMPYQFIYFVLRHFYSSAYHNNLSKLKIYSNCFSRTLLPLEETVIHLNIPLI